MKLSALMSKFTPNPDYAGFVTNDDWVLAVDIASTPSTKIGDYVVAQMGVAGLDAQMNPVTEDKQYIRAGQSTTKTGTQRTFSITGDRYVGDEFQDYCFSHDIAYGTGNAVVVSGNGAGRCNFGYGHAEAVVVPYVYFNVLNGKGEKGQASIIVNSDGSGEAGENAAIDISLNKVGSMPETYTYAADNI